MRHGKRFNHLGRKVGHRKAMLSNMACSLIEHKRISTTLAKARALRQYVEPIITKSKTDSTHSRRVVFSYLQNKEAVKELFGGVVEKVADRPGGYTRIIKTGNRLGDNAEMCIIELVDFNEFLLDDAGTKKKSRRRRSKKKDTGAPAVEATAEATEGGIEEATVVEDTAAEAVATEEAPAAEEESKSEDNAEEGDDNQEKDQA